MFAKLLFGVICLTSIATNAESTDSPADQEIINSNAENSGGGEENASTEANGSSQENEGSEQNTTSEISGGSEISEGNETNGSTEENQGGNQTASIETNETGEISGGNETNTSSEENEGGEQTTGTETNEVGEATDGGEANIVNEANSTASVNETAETFNSTDAIVTEDNILNENDTDIGVIAGNNDTNTNTPSEGGTGITEEITNTTALIDESSADTGNITSNEDTETTETTEDTENNSAGEPYTTGEDESTVIEPETDFPDEPGEVNSTEIIDPLGLPQNLPPTCDSFIYCYGILLHTIQMKRVFDDSKEFVDLKMVNDPGATLQKFQELMERTDNEPSKQDLKNFVSENFVSEQELIPWVPEDYVEDPCFLADIRSDELRRFASSIIKLWKSLGQKISEKVLDQSDRHSLIPIPNGFIASGGRYEEYYYWDNYWIIDSLIICGMLDTARGMIENFVTLILQFGFVPNGGRIYYSRRSQPPLLPFMVMRYYEETTDIIWLEYFISFFETEMQYWVDNRMITVTIGDKDMDVGIYRAESRGPRPEAYYEDVTNAEYFETKDEQQRYYSDIKASAESGWDSSSRWVFDDKGGTEANLTFSRTSNVIPVDLNAFLYGAFNIMSKFYLDLEDYSKQSYWHKRANDLKVVIQELFWNEEDGMWYDFDITAGSQRKNFYASNLTPLWTQALNETDCKKRRQVDKIIYYLKKEGLFDFPGGMPSSLQNTGKQWDMPNVWPPLQSIIVNGFYNTGVSNGKYIARMLAQKFLNATRTSFNAAGAMYQRYHAEHVGEPGPKGEYEAQKISAWTNAIALQFIDKFHTVRRF